MYYCQTSQTGRQDSEKTILATGSTDGIGPETARMLVSQAGALPAYKSPLELGKSVQTELADRPVTGPLFDFAPAINTFLQSHLSTISSDVAFWIIKAVKSPPSALANIAGMESQLKAHVGIATNVGLTEAQLSALATMLNQRVGMQAGHRLEQALQVVLSERAKA